MLLNLATRGGPARSPSGPCTGSSSAPPSRHSRSSGPAPVSGAPSSRRPSSSALVKGLVYGSLIALVHVPGPALASSALAGDAGVRQLGVRVLLLRGHLGRSLHHSDQPDHRRADAAELGAGSLSPATTGGAIASSSTTSSAPPRWPACRARGGPRLPQSGVRARIRSGRRSRVARSTNTSALRWSSRGRSPRECARRARSDCFLAIEAMLDAASASTSCEIRPGAARTRCSHTWDSVLVGEVGAQMRDIVFAAAMFTNSDIAPGADDRRARSGDYLVSADALDRPVRPAPRRPRPRPGRSPPLRAARVP